MQITGCPLGLAIYFARLLNSIATGQVLTTSYPWTTSLEVTLSFYIDLYFGI